MSARTIWELPDLSQGLRDTEIRWVPNGVALAYEFPATGWAEMTFLGVSAYSFTYDGSCTIAQIDAYDVLQEVVGEPWPVELSYVPDGCRYFRIYFDEIGCYEFLAQSFVPPPAPA